MSAEFDALKAKVTTLEGTVGDAMALLDALKAKIDNLPVNPDAAAMTALAAEVQNSIESLKAKIVADTPTV